VDTTGTDTSGHAGMTHDTTGAVSDSVSN
jgi:hypothetical protein